MVLVVVDEADRLLPGWAGQAERQVDPLKDRCVAAMADRFDGDLDPIESHARVARLTLHQQHAAGGDTREEGFSRGDLLTWPAQMGRLVDHELVIPHLVDGAPWRGRAGGLNPVHDQLVSGHAALLSVS